MTTAAIRSYRDLRVWQHAMDLVVLCYRASDSFPTTERYGLVSQMRRAAVSTVSNIAEGHARSRGDFVRFMLISAGSVSELETQIELSVRLGFMTFGQAKPLLNACDALGRMLGGLRRRIEAKRR